MQREHFWLLQKERADIRSAGVEKVGFSFWQENIHIIG